MHSAWQYFSFMFNAKNNHISLFTPNSSSDLHVSFWDSSGNVLGYDMGSSSIYPRYTESSSLGRFINSSGLPEYPLIGLIYAVSFYNTWDNGNPSTRSEFLDLHKNSFYLHFKLEDTNQNAHSNGLITKYVFINLPKNIALV